MCSCKGKSAEGGGQRACLNLYPEIFSYELKVIDIQKVTDDLQLYEISLQLREWVRNLTKQCPPDEDYTLVKQYVDDAYAEHIG